MAGFQFHPAVSRWLASQFASPTEAQTLGWPSIQSGSHTLIAAPTGSGKTLAAFLASLDRLFRSAAEGALEEATQVLYVSPLKALSNDIHKNLELPLQGIQALLREQKSPVPEVRAGLRTGDTSSSQRLALTRRPPHILVTTPESFYLLLTSESGRRMLRTVETLIVDEIHALAGNRRGSHLALSMERLDALTAKPVQRIGLSATQKPVEEVARFLVGARNLDAQGHARCRIADAGQRRDFDLAVEIPGSPLSAVMSNEVWEEVYRRLAQLIQEHRTTLIFVNTRRLAERVTHHLSGLLGADNVGSHHGSLSAKTRHEAERRLKQGELKALVATSSLELGIDIGSIDLVCQVSSVRSIASLLQRIGRAEHKRGGLPKGRVFPLTRDELVECAALLRAVRLGELDRLVIPEKPLDILAQQLVAAAAAEDWPQEELFDLVRRAYPYRRLTRREFDETVQMLANGFSTKRGRRGALIHFDGVHGRVRGRRGARLIAMTSGGAIPDNADYRVILEPSETLIGTINEDFAIESMAGDIFQLGNASWKIRRVHTGVVRVEDAQGQPPSIPFWLGEAPARTDELSRSVSAIREAMEKRAGDLEGAIEWLVEETGLPRRAALQMAEYFNAAQQSLGAIPSRRKLILERFFDDSGAMQLVLHSCFGSRINRAWGLALRKRFCRKFNFELQAAATDEAIVLSLGLQHSFPLEEVFRYLHAGSVRDLLIQALLDAPVFNIRWRWNANRALAVLRQRGGRKNPPPLQRMEAEDLLASVFPDQVACLEHIVGDRQIPDHPLVNQTIQDCLTEAMDLDGLIQVLQSVEQGSIECLARDLPEPSPLAHEVLNARPYAFLDNAPLEERRTQAVYARRTLEATSEGDLGQLDPEAIERVRAEAWPDPRNADELHEALLWLGAAGDEELAGCEPWLRELEEARRCGRFATHSESSGHGPPRHFWVAAERLDQMKSIFPAGAADPRLVCPPSARPQAWERSEAIRELVRGRLEVSGPVTASSLSAWLGLALAEAEGALLALEAEGFVLRGRFRSKASEMEWCERRLLARIHRLTLHRLRAEIQPVSVQEFMRFLLVWQRVGEEHRAEGPEGLAALFEMLDGYEIAAGAWEPEILSGRVRDYDPRWLDRLCFAGQLGWGRISGSAQSNSRPSCLGPVRSSPISIYQRSHLVHWLRLASWNESLSLSGRARELWNLLKLRGASFFSELVQGNGLLPSQAEEAIGELVALGCVTADSFDGLRALLQPAHKKAGGAQASSRRRHRVQTSVEFAGRWSLLRGKVDFESGNETRRRAGNSTEGRASGLEDAQTEDSEQALECYARVLLKRYGVVCRPLLEREPFSVSWYLLGRLYRRWEARGEIRGGRFIAGLSGEQFALPSAIEALRAARKSSRPDQWIVLSAADPLNLVGILTPGERVPAIRNNRILLRDGMPIAALAGGRIFSLDSAANVSDSELETRLKIGKLAPALRPFYR